MITTSRRSAGLACAMLLAACGTEPVVPTDNPGEPVAGLADAERARFLLGRALFERLATPEEGLGPLFNAERCSSCHLDPGTGGGGMAVPVTKATRFEAGVCRPLREQGGDNVQRRATPLLRALGMGAEEVPADATATVLVTTPPLFGLGLVEAVPEAALERLADPDDADGDGVSGRLPRLPDGRAARFGRKGDEATVRAFVESALLFEMGFTSEARPGEEARNGVPVPAEADPMPDPEMDDATVALLTDYVRYLAPTAPATAASAEERSALERGERTLVAVGCARCHTPVLETGPAAEAALSRRALPLWSDLLLHDLGEGEGDVCTPAAAPGEYRTAPLWGLRHRRAFFHDGRAPTLEEAILRHGGEAAAITAAWRALPDAERARALAFLGSR